MLLDGFSDLVWEKILTQCSYVEFPTKSQLFLFNTRIEEVEALVVKVTDMDCDLTTPGGFQWILKNVHSDALHCLKPLRNIHLHEMSLFILTSKKAQFSPKASILRS